MCLIFRMLTFFLYDKHLSIFTLQPYLAYIQFGYYEERLSKHLQFLCCGHQYSLNSWGLAVCFLSCNCILEFLDYCLLSESIFLNHFCCISIMMLHSYFCRISIYNIHSNLLLSCQYKFHLLWTKELDKFFHLQTSSDKLQNMHKLLGLVI